MPRRDGTGPNGEGELTGRGLGNCTNEDRIVKSSGESEELDIKRNANRPRFGRRCGNRGNRKNRRGYCQ